MRAPMLKLLGLAAPLLLSLPDAQAAACGASVTFGSTFSGLYSCNDLGTPEGIAPNLGGLTFLDANTLLIGGAANGSAGVIRQIDVVRDGSNRIVGFAGPSTPYATAPFIDGGLSFGPGGVLFATGYPNNTLLQYKPGSTTPDKIINLSSLVPNVGPSVGALAFVPAGFGGAGQMKIVSYNSNQWYTATLTPDGTGTFDVSVTLETTIFGGGEGMVYIDGANAGFSSDSVLVSEWSAGRVGAYEIDANGDPIAASRIDFLSGLSGAEGAVIDPLTGDFLFSTFGGDNRVLVIGGFLAPEPPPPGSVPEPAHLAFLGIGLMAALLGRRRAS